MFIKKRFAIEYDKNAYKCVWDNEEDELICGNEKLVDKLNELHIANKEYEILLDEYRKTVKHQTGLLVADYEKALSFIKSKGYSLEDLLEYEKELKKDE